MSNAKYTPKQIAERGEEMYAANIRNGIGSDDKGKYVVIDIESGNFEIHEDEVIATDRSLDGNPDAILYGIRIGYPTAYTVGVHLFAE